jgi:hypothetical protein
LQKSGPSFLSNETKLAGSIILTSWQQQIYFMNHPVYIKHALWHASTKGRQCPTWEPCNEYYVATSHQCNNMSIYRPTQLICYNYCLLCSKLHVSANPYGHLQASAWGAVLQYSTTVLQLYNAPYVISYYEHHSCVAVKYKFYNPVDRWGYVRYSSCSPGAFSCAFCIVPVYFLFY